MTKRRIILVSVVCFSLTVLTVQTLSQAPMPKHSRNMSEAERKREAAKRREQRKLEREQRRKEHKKKLDEIRERQKERKESWEKAKEEAGGFIHEKYALRATEEQWKVIKPKLEKVRLLRDLERSTVNLGLTSSSGSQSVPTWKWRISWKDKAPAELTEAQKLAQELVALVEKKNTSMEEFEKKMDALRVSRKKQENLNKQLAEARKELREVLTVRQEAALVLMKWL